VKDDYFFGFLLHTLEQEGVVRDLHFSVLSVLPGPSTGIEPPDLAGPLDLAKWFEDGCPDEAISASGNSSLPGSERLAQRSPQLPVIITYQTSQTGKEVSSFFYCGWAAPPHLLPL